MALRTPQDFDGWYRSSGGDPWGINRPSYLDRLDASLGFIAKNVDNDFRGTFIELGAFNGEFTKRLAVKFPNAAISASDISPVAVEMAQKTVEGLSNVKLGCADMATFASPSGMIPPVKLLLLECLYYLPVAEWAPAIDRLSRNLGRPDIFISCPITGTPYPTEPWLMNEFKKLNYRCMGLKVMNYGPPSRHLNRIRRKLLFIAAVRRRTANQVIYRFSPN